MAGSIGDRIAVLKQELGISSNRELEKGGLPGEEWVVSNGLLAKWESSDPETFSTSVVERFLNHYKVNRDWWKTGKGEVFAKNGTYVEIPNRKDTGEVYRNIVEGNTEYVLIPRTVLNDTQIVSSEQIKRTWDELAERNKELAEKNKELERKSKQLDFYHEQFAKLMENLELAPKSSKPKEV